MSEISAALVKDLREKSGAGMMDCKKALVEAGGDVEAAMDWLRKKGLSAAAKKSGRVAAEGLVGVISTGTEGAIVEINAETDFVARNEQFQDFVEKATALALKNNDVDALKAADMGGKNTQDRLTDLVATIGENMQVRRVQKLSVSSGVIATYMHNALKPGLGKIGVLIALESTGDKSKLEALGKQLAMHVAAARPEALDIASVSQANLEREKDILRDQAKTSGKAADIIEKMLEGRIRKYYEQVVLLEQTFIVDGESKISAIIEKTAKDIGAPITLKAYARFELGEGIEKQQDDFAAEVAKMAGVG